MSRPQIYEQMNQMATRIEERLENLAAIYKKPNLDQAADIATSCISSAMENILEVLRPIEDEQTFVKDVMGILKMRHDLQNQMLRSEE